MYHQMQKIILQWILVQIVSALTCILISPALIENLFTKISPVSTFQKPWHPLLDISSQTHFGFWKQCDLIWIGKFSRMPMKPEVFSPTVIVNREVLRERLSPIEYQVTQEKHTERPFTNKYYKHKARGKYLCKVCAIEIFCSSTKYDSGSGWPSFYDVISKDRVFFRQDASGIGGNLLLIVKRPELIRTEVICRNCGSHLGHVFKDGPKPTGQRYCINSSALDFQESTGGGGSDDESVEELLQHPATLGGCDGSNGLCSLKRNLDKMSLKDKAATP